MVYYLCVLTGVRCMRFVAMVLLAFGEKKIPTQGESRYSIDLRLDVSISMVGS